MSKQDNIYNLAGQYNSRLHISNFIEPLIEPLKKKYGVKVDELSILWDQVFEDQYKDQVYPKKITNSDKEYIKFGEKNKFHKLIKFQKCQQKLNQINSAKLYWDKLILRKKLV